MQMMRGEEQGLVVLVTIFHIVCHVHGNVQQWLCLRIQMEDQQGWEHRGYDR